tara:strand:+ start:93 stop:1055 length:963 start_codon:yes stop_codon:yes gene_type:complete
MRCLITGASGFIGSALSIELLKKGHDVKCIVRNVKSKKLNKNPNLIYIELGNIDIHTDWKNILKNVDCIIHCAARAHLTINDDDNYDSFKSLNVDGTKKLAIDVLNSEVKRFIYISSIGVNGPYTKKNQAFSNLSNPNPKGSYAISKYESEIILKELFIQSKKELVIIRPPTVYGPNLKGNFSQLISFLDNNFPLPFESIQNKKSYVSIENLVDLISVCVDHKNAGSEIFLVSDDQDISTANLIKKISSNLDIKRIIFPTPIFLLSIFFKIIGKKEYINKFMGSLEIDIEHTKNTLNWKPKYNLENCLKNTIDWYLQNKR